MDYFVKLVLDGQCAFKDETFVVNNAPFVNRNGDIDPLGGVFVSSGKGSHSYTVVNGVAKMKKEAGIRNGQVFALLMFATPKNAATGEFLVGKELKLIGLEGLFFHRIRNYSLEFGLNSIT